MCFLFSVIAFRDVLTEMDEHFVVVLVVDADNITAIPECHSHSTDGAVWEISQEMIIVVE